MERLDVDGLQADVQRAAGPQQLGHGLQHRAWLAGRSRGLGPVLQHHGMGKPLCREGQRQLAKVHKAADIGPGVGQQPGPVMEGLTDGGSEGLLGCQGTSL